MPIYKDEKTGLWYCKFVYTDWTGQKKQKKKMEFRLQKDAKQFEIDFLSKASRSCDMKFGDFVDIYMEDCKARLKPTTYKGKETLFSTHILPYFRNLKVNEIQPMTIRKWQTELMSNGKHYKPTYLRTINNQDEICQGFFLQKNIYLLPFTADRKWDTNKPEIDN